LLSCFLLSLQTVYESWRLLIFAPQQFHEFIRAWAWACAACQRREALGERWRRAAWMSIVAASRLAVLAAGTWLGVGRLAIGPIHSRHEALLIY
jgi:hypothetical protein